MKLHEKAITEKVTGIDKTKMFAENTLQYIRREKKAYTGRNMKLSTQVRYKNQLKDL